MQISVVVPFRNEERHIARCLTALTTQEPFGGDYEIIAVADRSGTHYVSCALDQLATTVSRLLEDGAERERITSAAHAFVTTELTMRDSVARIAALAGRI